MFEFVAVTSTNKDTSNFPALVVTGKFLQVSTVVVPESNCR